MKIPFHFFLPLIVSLIALLLPNKAIANIADSLYHPTLGNLSHQESIENTIATNYSTIQSIVPHLRPLQQQIPTIKGIIENHHKVEKLWGFYEEAKRDGTDLMNNPLTHELAFSTQYTFCLLYTSDAADE